MNTAPASAIPINRVSSAVKTPEIQNPRLMQMLERAEEFLRSNGLKIVNPYKGETASKNWVGIFLDANTGVRNGELLLTRIDADLSVQRNLQATSQVLDALLPGLGTAIEYPFGYRWKALDASGMPIMRDPTPKAPETPPSFPGQSHTCVDVIDLQKSLAEKKD